MTIRLLTDLEKEQVINGVHQKSLPRQVICTWCHGCGEEGLVNVCEVGGYDDDPHFDGFVCKDCCNASADS